jgi:hypothetical protein
MKVDLTKVTENRIEFRPIETHLIFESINETNNGCDNFTFISLAGPREIEGFCWGSAASGRDSLFVDCA